MARSLLNGLALLIVGAISDSLIGVSSRVKLGPRLVMFNLKKDQESCI